MPEMRFSLVAGAVLLSMTTFAPAASAAPDHQIRVWDLPAGMAVGTPMAVNTFGVAAGVAGEFGRGRAVVWKDGRVTDLGPGGAFDVNVFGHVVGITTDPEPSATLWRGGRATALTPDRPISAIAINTWGDVVVVSGTPQKFRVWRGGAPVELPAPGEHRTGGMINDRGQVAIGSSEGVFRCTTTACTALPVPAEPVNVHAMNGAGQILGTAVSGEQRALLWTGQRSVDIGHLGGGYTEVASRGALSALGHVVGSSKTPEGRFHAFVWRDGVMTDLGEPGRSSFATAVNDLGDAVGAIDGSGGVINQAALWRGGRLVPLPQLEGAPWCIARHITNLGHISGFCVTGQWQTIPVEWSAR